MNKQEAKNLIENTFSSDFDADKYQKFVANLFKKYSESNSSPTIKNAYQAFITKYTIIGIFEDSENNKIDILEVHLNKESTLERARTAQRNFVAEYLKSRNKEAALVAFISPNNKEWRLSLVKLEHTLEVVDKKLKAKEEITPAKRWSFLVGEHEGSHTAQTRFVNLLINDKEPNLAELEVAFDIEIVTREFFKKYTELFFQFKEKLDELLEKDEIIKKDFKEKEISTVDFAKKTLGQIVFLYFLQKKGWFGVPADKKWGEGPKKFIRELFKRRKKYGSNFFNNILEPLFYEALAQDRGKESIYPRLNNCRMPFLNGGLFEPMNNYKWETTDIIIPDELFSNNIKTKEGDIGTGILDVFDRYNFTVNENEPLEKEVAVDPEMLGKVFENLLDIKDRKSKGAFYTPREIVHYMCQESLINYLETETKNKIPREDLEFLIHKGDRIIENDKVSLEKTKGGKYPNEYYKIFTPDSIIVNAILLNELLKNIKVADPAVGSGAFPLGMINEIVRARKVLNIYLNKNVSDYELKKHAITHSIYGVDIDSGAVDIAKLRLWLALVVDEDTPRPLPNLEHKIMQGNSLISEYEGIKLFDETIFPKVEKNNSEKNLLIEKIKEKEGIYMKGLQDGKFSINDKTIKIVKELKGLKKQLEKVEDKPVNTTSAMSLFDDNKESLLDIINKKTEKLSQLTKQFISESQKTTKQNLKKQIDDVKWNLIEMTLKQQGKDGKLEKIKELRKKNIKPFFIWKLEFSDVFKEKGGFDIVIGNPPYVKEYTEKEAFDGLRKSPYYMGKMDLWYFFACYGLDLLKDKGIQAFIAPNNWISNFGAKLMRKKIIEESKIYEFIDFGNYKVFDTAGIQTMVYVLLKTADNSNYKIKYARLHLEQPSSNELTNFLEIKFNIVNDKYEKFIFSFEKEKFKNKNIQFLNQKIDKVISKIQNNEVFYLSNKEVAQGIVLPQDFLNKKNQKILGGNFKKGDGIFALSKIEKDNLNLQKDEDVLIKPYFMNDKFYKYGTDFKNNFWIIYTDSKFKNSQEINKYPSIKKHLDQFKKVITSDNKPYGLHRSREEHFFKNEKIVVARKCIEPTFSYNDFDCYVSATFYVIQVDKVSMKFLTGLLNSSLIKFWLKYKGKMQGNNYQIDKEPLVSIPIKKILPEEQKLFIDLVDQILEVTSQENYDPKNPPIQQKELEKKIDEMVYELYGLTEEEIGVIEESFDKK